MAGRGGDLLILTEELQCLIESLQNRYFNILKNFFISSKPNGVCDGENHLYAFFVCVGKHVS
jgi:hypothetical protein